ncbi:diguanylate cyclase [Xylophilus sp. GW821-FHT01B05]
MSAARRLQGAWKDAVQAWASVGEAPAELERWAAFMLHCDRLHNLAQEHGMAEVEHALAPLLQLLGNIAEPADAAYAPAHRLVPAIAEAVHGVYDGSGQLRAGSASERAAHATPTVLVLSRDEAATEDLLLQMEHYGYRVLREPDAQRGLATAAAQRPLAVIVDLTQGFEPAAPIVAELTRLGLPWCALARQGDYALRLQAVRQGALFFFLAPLSIDTLVEVLDPLAYPQQEAPYRVLVLDDSRTVLASVRQALRPYPQLHLGVLSRPERVLDVLNYYWPDVLLLDFHLRDCTGLEVARIIRQHKAFESIPIVYLTSETREAMQQEAMRHGGDDFLIKPVGREQLFHTVLHKARRYRGLRKLMVEDSLTGLYNHVKTKSLLQQSLAQAERQRVPLCYAILDIDHFKRVNDGYGHAIGDKVIKALARHLRQHLRDADIVGRYGGEEFVVVLRGCTPEQAQRRLDALRESFGQLYHAYDDGIFVSTFSAGIAHYPACGSMTGLMAAADAALYAAKRAGRNQVLMADTAD